jgi:hypothetical protein
VNARLKRTLLKVPPLKGLAERRRLGRQVADLRTRLTRQQTRADELAGEVRRARDHARVQRQILQEQQQRYAALSSQLQELREHAAEVPALERLRWVFILTYGRSGSTLLQGLLTRTPGVLIRGENGGVLRDLFGFHRTAMHHRRRLTRYLPRDPLFPWYGIDGFPEDESLRLIRRLFVDTVIRPRPDTELAGFKEIRWAGEDAEDFVEFVRQVFPGAKFVFNTRDLDQVARSGWWADRPDALEEVTRQHAQLAAIAASLGDDCFHIHYNDYVSAPDGLQPLFEWLGIPWDEDMVRDALTQSHSYDNRQTPAAADDASATS